MLNFLAVMIAMADTEKYDMDGIFIDKLCQKESGRGKVFF